MSTSNDRQKGWTRLSMAWRPPLSKVMEGLLLPVLVILAYLPALSCGYIWDDNMYVLQDPSFRGPSGLYRVWFEPGARAQFYPLVYSAFWFEYYLWGLQPLGYHLVNVCLHGLNATLLWILLKRLQAPGAWWVAAVFALHPVHVESVAWITELKNVLSGFFYLSAILAYLNADPRLLEKGDKNRAPWSQNGWYCFSLWLFLCALLSKTVTCSLPVALVLIYWFRGVNLGRRTMLKLFPFFLLGALLGLTTVWMERAFVGAEGTEWNLSFAERCLIAGRALWFYAGKLLYPVNLIFIYPRWEVDDRIWRQYLYPCAAAGVLVALWVWRGKFGRGPLVAVLFYVATLFPAMGFFNVFPMRYSYVADHFQYFASVGLIVLVVGTLRSLTLRLPPAMRTWAGGLAITCLILLGALTWKQISPYRDEKTLWQVTLRKNPTTWMAHFNLAKVFAEEGNHEEAIRGYEDALNFKPDCAEALNEIALIYKEQGLLDKARLTFEKAIELKPSDARFHHNYANLLVDAGAASEAIDQYQAALKLDPKFVETYVNLANLVAASGEYRRALSYLTEATLIAPNNALPFNNLGNLLSLLGNHEAAIENLKRALRLDPGYAAAHFNLGQSLSSIGDDAAAAVAYRNAISLKPEWPEPAINLAILMAMNKDAHADDLSEAIELVEKVCIDTRYKNPSYLAALAVVYSRVGRTEESEKVAAQSLALAEESGGIDARKSLEKRLAGMGIEPPK